MGFEKNENPAELPIELAGLISNEK